MRAGVLCNDSIGDERSTDGRANKLRGDGDDDDLEDLAWQNSIPNTFGKESDKLGRPISNAFGTGFLQRVAAAGKDGVIQQ